MRSEVSIRKIGADTYDEIKDTVRQVIEDIGGLEDIVRPGNKVIIKPNLVAVPERRLSGAVTRWEVCLAVAEIVMEYGGSPAVAESASVGADTEDVILFCGYNNIREAGIPVVDLKGGAGGRQRDVSGNISSWEFVTDADAIITVPVMKTHDQTEITLGMKNMKGILPDSVKKRFHREGLIERVVELNTVLKPCLEIIDGTYAAEGMGPLFGDTKRMGLIIGSKDIVACEAVCGEIMGYDPKEVPITRVAAEAGIGTMDLDDIDIIGETVKRVADRFARSCETRVDGLPDSFKMVFEEGACTGCRNSVLSVLIDMRDAGLLGYTESLTAIAGIPEGDLPEDPDPANVVCVGNCAMKYAEEHGLGIAAGCPPRNNPIVRTFLRGMAEYDNE